MNETGYSVQEQVDVPVAVHVGPVGHKHHWSIYLVSPSMCLLIAGLASDPRMVETVRSLLALR